MNSPNQNWLTRTCQRMREQARRLKSETFTLYFAYRDPRVPWYARIFAAIVVAYAISPIDLIPDFIPIFGYLDDLILIPAGIAIAIRMIPPVVMEESRIRAQQRLSNVKPGHWIVAAVIIMTWVVLGVCAFTVLRRMIIER